MQVRKKILIYFFCTIMGICGLVAQLVEQETLNLLVVGSSPTKPNFFFINIRFLWWDSNTLYNCFELFFSRKITLKTPTKPNFFFVNIRFLWWDSNTLYNCFELFFSRKITLKTPTKPNFFFINIRFLWWDSNILYNCYTLTVQVRQGEKPSIYKHTAD